MARRKKKRTASYRRKRSTKAGGYRRTARRAYAPKRRATRRRRSNPKGVLQTPAVRYVAFGGVGAGLFMAIESAGLLKQIPNLWARAGVAALITGFLARMVKNSKTRANLTAMAAGMVLPPVSAAVADVARPLLGNGNGAPAASPRLRGGMARSIASTNSSLSSARAHAAAASKNVLK